MVDSGTANDEAWQHGRLLRVGSATYIVDRNPPVIEKVQPAVSATAATAFASRCTVRRTPQA